MRYVLIAVAALSGLGGTSAVQPSPANDVLLQRLAGAWILRGDIAGRATTHDVTAEWILDRLYLQLHEVSREKAASGKPAYEAVVLLGWDAAGVEYQCLWLDSTGGGGLTPASRPFHSSSERRTAPCPSTIRSPTTGPRTPGPGAWTTFRTERPSLSAVFV